jgi:hypothetical protein
MNLGREKMSARVVTLMTRRQKSDLQTKAQKAGLSAGEIVRRSVNAYDPEEARQLEEIAVFFRACQESTERVPATK